MGKRGPTATFPGKGRHCVAYSRWGNAGQPQLAADTDGAMHPYSRWGNAGQPQHPPPAGRVAVTYSRWGNAGQPQLDGQLDAERVLIADGETRANRNYKDFLVDGTIL